MKPIDLGLQESYTVFFLLCVSFAIYIGCRTVPIYKVKSSCTYNKPIFTQKITSSILGFLILIILGYLWDLFAHGLGGLTLALGENYEKMLDMTGESLPTSLYGQLYVLASPLRYFMFSYGVYNFSKFNKINKILYIGLLLVAMSHSIFGLGTQKGVGDIVIIVTVTLYVKAVKNRNVKTFAKYAIVIFVLFIGFFSFMQASRSNHLRNDGSIQSNAYIEYNRDNLMVKCLGKNVGEGLIRFGWYISNGYPGLNYCLQMPFEWTNGYGGSRAGNDYLHRYFGLPSKFENSYPMRMENERGWPGLMFWPTAFAWWASDLTWAGIIILMAIFAKIICIMFKEAYYYSNPLSLVLLSYLSIGIVYLPANNQLMQSSGNFVSTIFLLILWFMFRKKYNYASRCSLRFCS